MTEPGGLRVREAMIGSPKVMDAGARVGDVRAALDNDHVHMALLVRGERLEGTVVRRDLPPPGDAATEAGPAAALASLEGRTVGPDDLVEDVRLVLASSGARRVAVVDRGGRLLGLVCLKRHRNGYCDDAGVAARAAERELAG